MAERTNNIWNDDDGEKEQKPRKKHRVLKGFLLFFLTLVVVLGVVLVAAWRDGTGFDALRRYFSYGKAESASGTAAYRYDASVRNRFALLEDRLFSYLLEQIGEDGQVIDASYTARVSEGQLHVTLTAECREEIGRETEGWTEESGEEVES